MRLQPVEDRRIALADAHGHDAVGLRQIRTQQGVVDRFGQPVCLPHVAEEEVVSRNLAGRPPRQPLHVAQVGQRRALQLLHPRRIESRHLEPVAAGPLVAGDEEHLHLVARMYAQQARRACGEQQLLRTQRIAYARQPPFGEPAGEKRPVVGAVHPFERHALHGIARAHDPALDGIGRRPLHAVNGAQQRFEPSSRRDGPRLRGVDPGAVDHLDRRRKAHHAGRHFAFETEDHGQRHEHHGHRYGHRNHGDARHHPGPVLRRGAGGAARYEKFEVQTTAIFTVKFHAK